MPHKAELKLMLAEADGLQYDKDLEIIICAIAFEKDGLVRDACGHLSSNYCPREVEPFL
jgi:hypothetical protein